MPPKNNSNNKNQKQSEPDQEQVVAQVVVLEGEKIWWLFLADKPLPEDIPIGKANVSDASFEGWYLDPDPKTEGDFIFRKYVPVQKERMLYYGVIARDVPMTKIIERSVTGAKRGEYYILSKQDRKFVDETYQQFTKAEEAAKKQKKQHQGKPKGASSSAGTTKNDNINNKNEKQATQKEKEEAERIAKEELKKKMLGWKVLNENVEQQQQEQENTAKLRYFAVVRVPTTQNEIESMFDNVNASSNPPSISSKTFLNEVIVVAEEKNNNNNDDADNDISRIICLPVMSPSPTILTKKKDESEDAVQNENDNEDDKPLVISKHVQGKGNHSLLLSMDSYSSDVAANKKKAYAHNASLVDSEYLKRMESSSGKSDASGIQTSSVDRFTSTFNFLTATPSEQISHFKLGTLFFFAKSFKAKKSIIDEPIGGKHQQHQTFICKEIPISAVFSQEGEVVFFKQEFMAELVSSALSAVRAIFALTLVENTKNATKNEKKKQQKSAKKNKNAGSRRQRNDDDDDETSSEEEDDEEDESSSEDDDDDSESDSNEDSSSSDSNEEDDDSDCPRKNNKKKNTTSNNKNAKKNAAAAANKKKNEKQPAAKKQQQQASKDNSNNTKKQKQQKLDEDASPSNTSKNAKSSRNQKAFSLLLDEINPAASTSNRLPLRNDKDTKDTTKSKNSEDDDAFAVPTSTASIEELKEKAKFTQINFLLEDVGASVMYAKSKDEDGNNINEDAVAATEEQQTDDSNTTENTTTTQSTAYPGAGGESVVPTYY